MFAIIVIVLVTLIIYQSPQWYATLFPGIRRVHIEGNFIHIDRLRIEKVIDQATGGGFFEIDPAAIEQQLKRINWVKDAWVYRIWPRTLSIVLEERDPVAYWGESALLDTQAKVFYPEQIDMRQLPMIQGVPGREKFLLDTYKRMNKRLAALDLSIQFLKESDRRSLHLILSNGWALQLGRQQWDERLTRFITVYPVALSDTSDVRLHNIQCMDFRYVGSFAVSKQRQECYQ